MNPKILVLSVTLSIIVSFSLSSVVFAIQTVWVEKSQMPIARFSFGVTVVADRIYAIGGAVNTEPEEITGANEVYDPKTDTWSSGASIPVKVSGAGVATVTYPDETMAVCVVGGETDVFSPLSVTQIYFPKNNSWTTGASLPNVNSRLSVAYVDNTLYVIGGTRAVIHQGLAENLQCNIFNVIPEFPSWTILPLILSITMFSIAIKRNPKEKASSF